MGDFEVAITNVQPSAKREGFATIPDVTWQVTTYRHRRRHVNRAGRGVPVLKTTASPPLRGGHFEYRHAHTHAMDLPSAMPR